MWSADDDTANNPQAPYRWAAVWIPGSSPAEPQTPTTADPNGDTASWPALLTATPNVAEVLEVAVSTGDVADRFRPELLANGGISGATGASDGRIAMWADSKVAVRADGRDFGIDLRSPERQLEPGGGELQVLMAPAAPAAWIVQPTGPQGTRIWKWDYTTDELAQTTAELPQGLFPAGATRDGRLVLNNQDADTVAIAGPRPGDAVSTMQGSALAVHDDSVLIRQCTRPGDCRLTVFRSGSVRPIDTGGRERLADQVAHRAHGPLCLRPTRRRRSVVSACSGGCRDRRGDPPGPANSARHRRPREP